MPTTVAQAGPEAQVIERSIALEYDCLAAYRQAADAAQEQEFAQHVKQFAQDCERHIKSWQQRLEQMSMPKGTPSKITEPLNKGKVKLSSLVGDHAIALAIKNNAVDSCTAYEQVHGRTELAPETIELSQQMLRDATRHREWIERYLQR